jgi:hypothetical protein
MPRQTFQQTESLAMVMPSGVHDGLRFRVLEICASASLNAFDTIQAKEATEDQFDALALSSLQSLLCDSGDSEVCDWFVKNGVMY